MIKAVFFDWDGTLYDIFDFMVQTYTQVMRERGLKAWRPKEYKERFRIDWRDMLKEMGLKEHEEELISAWNMNALLMQDKLKLHDGALEALKELKRDYTLGIVTSGPRKALDSELKRLGVDSMMNVTVAGEDVGKGKPHPEPLLLAACMLGIKPSECVYVGDMVEDIQAAKKAGMHPIAVSWGIHSREKLSVRKPYFLAENYGQLVEYIRRME